MRRLITVQGFVALALCCFTVVSATTRLHSGAGGTPDDADPNDPLTSRGAQRFVPSSQESRSELWGRKHVTPHQK